VHNELIETGVKWLRAKKCPVVLTEITGGAREQPDVFGLHSNGTTTLIECKASRPDFFADAKKVTRVHPRLGIGLFRYYLTPKELLDVDELPSGWGLLEFTGKKVLCKKKSCTHEYDELSEKAMVVSAIRRLKIESGKHTSLTVVSPYTAQTKCRTKLYIEE